MSATEKKLNTLLADLDDSDKRKVIHYVEYVVYIKDNSDKNTKIMDEIQKEFYGDKTWSDENAMLSEMAAFRRSRAL